MAFANPVMEDKFYFMESLVGRMFFRKGKCLRNKDPKIFSQ